MIPGTSLHIAEPVQAVGVVRAVFSQEFLANLQGPRAGLDCPAVLVLLDQLTDLLYQGEHLVVAAALAGLQPAQALQPVQCPEGVRHPPVPVPAPPPLNGEALVPR